MTSRRIHVLVPPPVTAPRGARAAAAAGFWIARLLAWRPSRVSDSRRAARPTAAPSRLHPAETRS